MPTFVVFHKPVGNHGKREGQEKAQRNEKCLFNEILAYKDDDHDSQERFTHV